MEGKKANPFDWPLGGTVYECLVNFVFLFGVAFQVCFVSLVQLSVASLTTSLLG